ncbi:MAG: hypothetical protein ACYSX0_15250 [Planctomycetota bacterium]
MPRREAGIALFLLALLVAALLFAPARPGPGPLAFVTSVAALHAALIAPSLARRGGAAWGLLPALLAVPALFATSYGHPGATPLMGAILIVTLSAVAGSAGRVLPRAIYFPAMLLVFLAPYALHYLVLEFGRTEGAGAWLRLSPIAAAQQGGWPGALCVLLLLVWPVWALAARRRA